MAQSVLRLDRLLDCSIAPRRAGMYLFAAGLTDSSTCLMSTGGRVPTTLSLSGPNLWASGTTWEGWRVLVHEPPLPPAIEPACHTRVSCRYIRPQSTRVGHHRLSRCDVEYRIRVCRLLWCYCAISESHTGSLKIENPTGRTVNRRANRPTLNDPAQSITIPPEDSLLQFSFLARGSKTTPVNKN